VSRRHLVASALAAVVASFSASCTSGDRDVDAPGRIAFVRSEDRWGGPIFIVNSDGSELRQVTRRPEQGFRGISWSPDGTTLVATTSTARGDDISAVAVGTGAERRVTRDPEDDWDAVWSPDGRSIAFDRNADGPNWIYVVRADGSGERRLTPDFNYDPTWSPDRGIAYIDSRGIWVMRHDGSRKRRLVRTALGHHGYERRSHVAWSPDGALLAYSTGLALWLVNADGSNPRQIFSRGGRTGYPVWSPDGTKIAFEQGEGDIEIYVVDVVASNERKLTDNKGIQDVSPSWSADSHALAFVSANDVFVMNADGSGKRNLTNSEETESEAVWSP
jgi:Tol biopolymer transport system component